MLPVYEQLVSVSMLPSRLSRLVACVGRPLLSKAEERFLIWTYRGLLIHAFYRHLGFIYLLFHNEPR